MREQTFEARFGELRSLLSGEVGQAGFDATDCARRQRMRVSGSQFAIRNSQLTRTKHVFGNM